MAKESSGGSVGGRRGGVVSSKMTVSEAKKKMSDKTVAGPKLGTSVPSMSNKVTNKPDMSGKRMK